MESNFLVYLLIDPRTLIGMYVGQSTLGLKRPRQHLRACEREDSSGENANMRVWLVDLHAHGYVPVIEVLEYVVDPFGPATNPYWSNVDRNPTALNEAERWHITLRGRADLGLGSLLNHTLGGEGARGWIPTTEIKNRIRTTQLTRVANNSHQWQTESHRENQRRRMTGRDNPMKRPEVAQKLASIRRGMRFNVETRERMSAAAKKRERDNRQLRVQRAARFVGVPRTGASRDAQRRTAAIKRLAHWFGAMLADVPPIDIKSTKKLFVCGTEKGYHYNWRRKHAGKVDHCGPCAACTEAHRLARYRAD